MTLWLQVNFFTILSCISNAYQNNLWFSKTRSLSFNLDINHSNVFSSNLLLFLSNDMSQFAHFMITSQFFSWTLILFTIFFSRGFLGSVHQKGYSYRISHTAEAFWALNILPSRKLGIFNVINFFISF